MLLKFNNPFSKDNEEKSIFSSEICLKIQKETHFDIISNKNKKSDLEILKINNLIQKVSNLIDLYKDNSSQINQNSNNIYFLMHYMQSLKS